MKRIFNVLLWSSLVLSVYLMVKDTPVASHAKGIVRFLSDRWSDAQSWVEGNNLVLDSADLERAEEELVAAHDELNEAIAKLESMGEAKKAARLKQQFANTLRVRGEIHEDKCVIMGPRLVNYRDNQTTKLVRQRDAAAKAQWETEKTILDIELQLSGLDQRSEQKEASASVTHFLTEVRGGKLRAVQNLLAGNAKVTKEKLKSLRGSLADLDGREFSLQGGDGRFEVLFEGKKRLSLAKGDGRWLVSKIW